MKTTKAKSKREPQWTVKPLEHTVAELTRFAAALPIPKPEMTIVETVHFLQSAVAPIAQQCVAWSEACGQVNIKTSLYFLAGANAGARAMLSLIINNGLLRETKAITRLTPKYTRRCPECKRVFDMGNDTDVKEWEFGHDCEVA